MAAAYEGGQTCREIARAENLHHITVGRKLRSAGVRVVPGGRHRKLREFSDDEMAEMVEMSRSGASRQRIADHFGSSQPVISRVLAAVGEHPIRPGKSGPLHQSWNGGVVSTGDGYLMELVSTDDSMAGMRNRAGYVPQHRLVMARSLGRPLTSDETVHHRNGVRDDNRIENLELRRGAHGKHQELVCLDCGSRNVGARPGH